MKTPLFLLLALLAAPLAAQENPMWNLPLAQQDTTITYTVAAGRVDSLVYVTSKGRHIAQAVYTAEYIAARLQLAPLSVTITPAEVQREVDRRRAEVSAALGELDADSMTATDYRQAARAIKARAREYTRTTKKGAAVME